MFLLFKGYDGSINLIMNNTIGDQNRSIKDSELSTIHACDNPTSFFDYLLTKKDNILK